VTALAFLLKAGNGNTPQTFSTVAGLRTTHYSVTPESASIEGRGVFTGTAAETRVRSAAASGGTEDYQISFENGERIAGRFLVMKVDLVGEFNGEPSYTVALESVGPVVTL
jgi:predicted secreted protein